VGCLSVRWRSLRILRRLSGDENESRSYDFRDLRHSDDIPDCEQSVMTGEKVIKFIVQTFVFVLSVVLATFIAAMHGFSGIDLLYVFAFVAFGFSIGRIVSI
jgi:hypothetical protein